MKTMDILYIEDNLSDIELTLRALKKHNVANSIQTISDGEEAMDYILAQGKYAERDINEKPKVILLDLKLPKVSGLEILKELKSKEHTRRIPVVILLTRRLFNDTKQHIQCFYA